MVNFKLIALEEKKLKHNKQELKSDFIPHMFVF